MMSRDEAGLVISLRSSWLPGIFSGTTGRAQRGHRRLFSKKRRSPGFTRLGRAPAHLPIAVDAYLKRIEAYDKQGPALNAIVVVNPNAISEAEALDRRFAQSGLAGPLHCVPTIVKDNFETIGLQSADGSLSLQGFVSNKDAFLVRRIRAAGAIVLAKSNMAEFAFSPDENCRFHPARLHAQPVRARPRHSRIERRDGGGGCRQLRCRRAWHRHRKFHPRSFLAPGSRWHQVDDGPHEPRRRRAAQPAG